MRLSLEWHVGCGRRDAPADRFCRNCELFQCGQASPTGGAGKHPRRRFLGARFVVSASSSPSRGASRRPRRAFLFPSPHPKRGWRSADRRTLLLCRACEARRPRERNAGRPVATGTPSRRSVVAIFGRGPALPASGSGTGADKRLAHVRPYGLMGGVPGLPRCGSRRNRGTPLLAPSSGSSPETPPSSEDGKSIL